MKNYSGIDEDKDKIISMIHRGMSSGAIAKILPYSKSTILKFMKRNGIKSTHKSSRNDNNLLKDKLDEVIMLHQKGLTYDAIAKKLGHASASVRSLLRKHGYTDTTQYNLNETFFKDINTPEKAYILGWFYSDGCVHANGKMRIQIQKEDEDILYQIKDLINYDGPIYEIPPPKKFPHRKPQVCLCINRKLMANDLIKHGCIPNKSLVLKYPTWITRELEPHFLRGFFDGDGSICLKRKKYASVAITTTDVFNMELQHRLSLIGIDSQYYYRYEHTNTCSLQITKHNHAISFLDYIYQDSSIHLNRKYEIYLIAKQLTVCV